MLSQIFLSLLALEPIGRVLGAPTPGDKRIVIGYRSVHPDQAKRYQEAGTITDDGNHHANQIGAGVYMTAEYGMWDGDPDEVHCVVTANEEAFNKVPKASLSDDGLLDSSDEDIAQEIKQLDSSWDPAKTIKISHIPKYWDGTVLQMLLPNSLLNSQGGGLDLKVEFGKSGGPTVDYSKFQNLKGAELTPLKENKMQQFPEQIEEGTKFLEYSHNTKLVEQVEQRVRNAMFAARQEASKLAMEVSQFCTSKKDPLAKSCQDVLKSYAKDREAYAGFLNKASEKSLQLLKDNLNAAEAGPQAVDELNKFATKLRETIATKEGELQTLKKGTPLDWMDSDPRAMEAERKALKAEVSVLKKKSPKLAKEAENAAKKAAKDPKFSQPQNPADKSKQEPATKPKEKSAETANQKQPPVKGKQPAAAAGPPSAVFYSSFHWPNEAKEQGGFLPDPAGPVHSIKVSPGEEATNLDWNKYILPTAQTLGEAAKQASDAAAKGTQGFEGVVYAVHTTPNMIKMGDQYGAVGCIRWQQVMGWLQVPKDGLPQSHGAKGKEDLRQKFQEAFEKKTKFFTPNKDYDHSFDQYAANNQDGLHILDSENIEKKLSEFMNGDGGAVGGAVGWGGKFPILTPEKPVTAQSSLEAKIKNSVPAPHEEGFFEEVWDFIKSHAALIALPAVALLNAVPVIGELADTAEAAALAAEGAEAAGVITEGTEVAEAGEIAGEETAGEVGSAKSPVGVKPPKSEEGLPDLPDTPTHEPEESPDLPDTPTHEPGESTKEGGRSKAGSRGKKEKEPPLLSQ
ncbi:hypothetical protein CDD81_2828 [Ophiocordyceps australis]|uniref:Enterotoxin n=1 Tax=Ophiocordyceps australis TaxID=1399860 RepID=A0A2C5XWU6_9HYPO|nr:hypothetical protein CDD81_2828 [Ophiocordyceps australis]